MKALQFFVTVSQFAALKVLGSISRRFYLLRDSPTATPFTSFPCTLGHELCGEIIEVGSNVDGLGTGDMVSFMTLGG